MQRPRTLCAIGLGAALTSLAGIASGWLDGPCGMVPGGRLHGHAEACTRDRLAALSEVRESELEVRPTRPRSMTTWSVVHDGAFYVPADFLTPWKRWPRQVLADPRVRLRAGGHLFECHAERVDDPVVIEALRAAIARKYDLDPEGRAARVEVWWFRLDPRAAAGGGA